MATPPWYVITGGPCAGKTTLIRELARRGYATVPETARAQVEKGLAAGKTLGEIRRDEVEFQRIVLAAKVANERSLPRDRTLFFDRGMHDSVAYMELTGAGNDPALAPAIQASTYRKVFLLDLLPFEQDEVRVEDAATAADIHERLADAYARADIPLVRVPVMPVSERADFVLAHL